jgi:hypothetical protein
MDSGRVIEGFWLKEEKAMLIFALGTDFVNEISQ